ncbi:hypothetical protein V8B97DRAFT_1375974 [Scleroderma yunnanense]
MAYNHYIPIIKPRTVVPEIGGSQAGFIGLVVFLGVLIVVCCSAVFYLLRHHEPTDQDRAARRERYRRHQAELDNSTAPSETSFGEKFKRAWDRIRHGERRGGRGWIQAGSGDEWEFNPDCGDQAHATRGESQSPPKDDTSNISRIVESSLSGSRDGFVSPHYCDPFTNESPISQSVDVSETVRTQSPLSVSTSKEDGSDEELDSRGHRHFSSLSTASGTRFVEHV